MNFSNLIKSVLIPIVTIAVFALILSMPLLEPGLHTIHDDQQVARLFEFDKSAKSGHFPVRWIQNFGFGYGYPLFVFYPPLVYMVGELFHLLGFGYVDSIKLVFAAGILLSGIAMYIASKEFFGKVSGLVAALFYMLAPYRAVDVYVRGALAESFSFVFLPLIIWSFYKLKKTNSLFYCAVSALFLSLLMITHNLIFLPFMIVLPPYLLFLYIKSKDKKRFAIYSGLSVALGFALSAFFWLPALAHKSMTIVDDLLLVNLASYNIHFVEPAQLWNSLWGFGGSTAGPFDGVSFKIGKLHVISAVLALFLSASFVIRNVKTGSGKYQKTFLFSLLFIFSAILTTVYSKPLWDILTPLQYLQFPWRFLTFIVLFASFAVGGLIWSLKLPILRLVVSTLLIFLLAYANIKLFKPQSYRFDFTDRKATDQQLVKWEVSGSSFEYLPKGVSLAKNDLGANSVNITKDDVAQKRVEVLSGDAQVTNLSDNPAKITFDTSSQSNSEIQVNIYNYPLWQAKVDGKLVEKNQTGPLKLITVDVEKGSHNILLEFKNSQIMNLANMISLITLIPTIFLIIPKKWKNRTN